MRTFSAFSFAFSSSTAADLSGNNLLSLKTKVLFYSKINQSTNVKMERFFLILTANNLGIDIDELKEYKNGSTYLIYKENN